MLAAGTFANPGQPEDSLFVGWVKNGNMTAWYNNTRKESGLEVQMDGAFVGFGLRGSTGTIAIARTEGRSVQD